MAKAEHHWDFLDMGVIARLSRLTVSVRLPMLGSVTGIHRSATRGSSVEFAEYRKYAPGDDLKFLDWRVFARTDKYFIREFEADTNLRCYVVLDTSASMKFTSGEVTRFLHIWPYPSLEVRAQTRKTAIETGVWPPPGGPDHLLTMRTDIFLPAPFSPIR